MNYAGTYTGLHGHVHGPHIDVAGLSPLIALLGGATIVLLIGLARGAAMRERVVPGFTLLVLAAAAGLSIWQWDTPKSIVSAALRVDDLALVLNLVFVATAIAAVVMSWRAAAPRESAHGEYHGLLLTSVAGMSVLVGAQNTVTLFIGFELLSIPLYVMCATEMRRASSLESGLKYLVVGSVGSATLLYGLALIYGATGSTDYDAIATGLSSGSLATDPLMLTGIALVLAGLAFKASVAPFHQWTPDVYEGAPTPVTAFMAVATKAAAFGVLLRFFDVALIGAQGSWGPALAALATITIVVGNVGALGQTSLKRMLAYSGVAQAGYIMAGVVVSTRLGLEAAVFYLAIYVAMNVAAFAVVAARERETSLGDDIGSLAGLGAERPWLAWPMTIAMLALAGIPATAGFVGKLYLIQASVDGGYAWLGIVIVVGSMISLGYYLRVVATIWMRPAERPAGDGVTAAAGGGLGARPAIAGGSPEADAALPRRRDDPPGSEGPMLRRGASGKGGGWRRSPPAGRVARLGGGGGLAVHAGSGELVAVAVLAAAASVALGIVPSPLFDLARDAGRSIAGLL